MISNIKGRKKRNDNDELSKHFQDAEIVIRQESNVILDKTIQFKTKDDNEKTFSHKFSENDAVDYIAFVEKKRAQSKNLKIKREYQILLKKIKDCRFLFEMMKSICQSDANATSLERTMIFSIKFFNSNVSVQSLN